MAKVCDVLKLPALKGIQVAAGHAGLLKKVEHVTVMEVPDIKKWLKGNDFLITSFYSVRKSEEEQCRLIEELADTCCCVAVKTGEYVDRISECVRGAADKAGLPLLVIPPSMTYIDIIVNVMNQIFEEEGNAEILEKYVKDIIYENYSDEILMAERGRLFGFDVEKNFFAGINVSFRKHYAPAEQDWKTLRFLCQSLAVRLRESRTVRECSRISLKKGFFLLVESEDKGRLSALLSQILEESNVRGLWPAGAEKILCAAGPVLQGLSGIRDTYSASFKAMHVSRMLYEERSVCFYEDLKTFCALEESFSGGKGRVFTEILAPVDSKEFIDTLTAYYECGGSMERTAERLFTHKNTIKYRLNRIQERTGLDIKKPDDNFRLYLAVLAMKLGKE